jgi:hypothetical protein
MRVFRSISILTASTKGTVYVNLANINADFSESGLPSGAL